VNFLYLFVQKLSYRPLKFTKEIKIPVIQASTCPNSWKFQPNKTKIYKRNKKFPAILATTCPNSWINSTRHAILCNFLVPVNYLHKLFIHVTSLLKYLFDIATSIFFTDTAIKT
jgi:hypothetical protein